MKSNFFFPPNEITCATGAYLGVFTLLDTVGSNSSLLKFGVPLIVSLMTALCRYAYLHIDMPPENKITPMSISNTPTKGMHRRWSSR